MSRKRTVKPETLIQNRIDGIMTDVNLINENLKPDLEPCYDFLTKAFDNLKYLLLSLSIAFKYEFSLTQPDQKPTGCRTYEQLDMVFSELNSISKTVKSSIKNSLNNIKDKVNYIKRRITELFLEKSSYPGFHHKALMLFLYILDQYFLVYLNLINITLFFLHLFAILLRIFSF